MAKKHHGLYDESPSIKHDEAGHTKVEKPKKEAHTAGKEEKGVEGEGFPIHVRHAMERRNLHHMHETEHGIHDAHGAGAKAEIHARHESETKALHTKHEKEAGAHGGKDAGAGGATGEPVKKVEKNAK